MATFPYTHFTYLVATGAVNPSTADWRVRIVCSNSTAGVDRDATTVGAISVLDEYNGTGYTPYDMAAVGATKVDASDRTQVDANDGTFGAAVGPATRPAKALLYVIYVNGAANDIPAGYDDTPPQFASGTFNGDGGPMNLTLGPTGFLHIE